MVAIEVVAGRPSGFLGLPMETTGMIGSVMSGNNYLVAHAHIGISITGIEDRDCRGTSASRPRGVSEKKKNHKTNNPKKKKKKKTNITKKKPKTPQGVSDAGLAGGGPPRMPGPSAGEEPEEALRLMTPGLSREQSSFPPAHAILDGLTDEQ